MKLATSPNSELRTSNFESQPELPLRAREREPRAVDRQHVAELCAVLRGRGWMPVAAVMAALGWEKRFLRSVVRGSELRVLSYPGSPGLRLTAEMTFEDAEEIAHAAEARIAQGRDMWRTGIAFRRMAALLRAGLPIQQNNRHEIP